MHDTGVTGEGVSWYRRRVGIAMRSTYSPSLLLALAILIVVEVALHLPLWLCCICGFMLGYWYPSAGLFSDDAWSRLLCRIWGNHRMCKKSPYTQTCFGAPGTAAYHMHTVMRCWCGSYDSVLDPCEEYFKKKYPGGKGVEEGEKGD
jgi:hypothetical protein